jgi:uncharacterized NAD-dependent epimerase/dehydratase family protein
MEEDGIQVLRMLEEGKITPEDAAKLLDALQSDQAAESAPQPGKRILIKVTDARTGKKKVNLKIPIGLAKIAVKFIPPKSKRKLAEEGVDIDAVLSQVIAGNLGKIVDVESDEDLVEVIIE